MPYRAMLLTIFTTALALMAVGLWIHNVEPLLRSADGTESPASNGAAGIPSAPPTATAAPDSARSLRMIVKGTMLLAFVLISFLLIVGFFATLREWVRYRTTAGPARGKGKTRYVDAWKLAGERLNPRDEPPPSADDPEPESGDAGHGG